MDNDTNHIPQTVGQTQSVAYDTRLPSRLLPTTGLPAPVIPPQDIYEVIRLLSPEVEMHFHSLTNDRVRQIYITNWGGSQRLAVLLCMFNVSAPPYPPGLLAQYYQELLLFYPKVREKLLQRLTPIDYLEDLLNETTIQQTSHANPSSFMRQ